MVTTVIATGAALKRGQYVRCGEANGGRDGGS